VMVVKALKPARQPNERSDRGGFKADRRQDGQRRAHRNDRPKRAAYQPKRADGSVPGEARGPVRNPVRAAEGNRGNGQQRHPQRADGHPGHRANGPRGNRPFRGRGRPGGNRASA
jgi:ATP-dependent RNA helicase RhlE